MPDHSLLRQGQVVTTYGPGALVDLPRHSVIVGGLDDWTRRGRREIKEPRLVQKLQSALGVPALRLYTPPAVDESELREGHGGRPHVTRFLRARVFPTWFVTAESAAGGGGVFRRRRLVHWSVLDRGRYMDDDRKWKRVGPIRFVAACRRGHVDDVDWRTFVHGRGSECTRTLWLEERGTSGDVSDVVVGCDCGKSRAVQEAVRPGPLGYCNGKRPWLGFAYTAEECHEPARLLVRTASNSYFPELMSVISLPEQDTGVAAKLDDVWDTVKEVQSPAELAMLRRLVAVVRAALEDVSDDDAFKAIERRRAGPAPVDDTPVKQAEFDVIASGQRTIGRDEPEAEFFAETPDRRVWDPTGDPGLAPIERLVLVHRLRQVVAQVGFTRFDAPSTEVTGELDPQVERALLARDVSWLPAVEQRGEGVFLKLDPAKVAEWLARDEVRAREEQLRRGFEQWKRDRPGTNREFPGAAYVMVHSLAHLLLTAVALDCGYPASSLRERVYAFAGRYGILILAGSADAEGTLGGLVEAGRRIGRYVEQAREMATLCSNDPLCAGHDPDSLPENRFLHGAACHGCLLVAETSCEQRNDYLDRALVFPTIGHNPATAFLR